MELLERGVHVLCEKPLAESPVHAAEMVERATERGLALCVNHTRRLYPAYALVRRLLTEGNLGPLREIRYEEGFEFSWPATSAFHFRSGARGVLLDTGIHALDILCWWLGSKPELIRCQTDSYGGPEATAHIEMQHGDCRVDLKLSWLNKLSNQYTIVCERGTITGGVSEWDRLTIDHQNGKREFIRIPRCEKSYNEFGRRMIDNFLAVVAGRAESLVPAHEVLSAIELMDESYGVATRLALPWLEWREEVVDD
jgi:predicted dehydrogenase